MAVGGAALRTGNSRPPLN